MRCLPVSPGGQLHGGALAGIHTPASVTHANAAERLQDVLRPLFVLRENDDRLQ
jgi:hypothetical protein